MNTAIVCIPTYNERDNIEPITSAALTAEPRADILVVDDSSPDGTGQIADELSKKSGAAFDKAYMKMMVEDHDKDVAEFKKEQSSVKDGDLKGWLDKTIPVIEDHKKSAHDINKKLK